MLRINIPANGYPKISLSIFKNLLLPVPPKGIDAEANNNVTLLFDNEEQAASYSGMLKELSQSFNEKSSALRKIRNEIIEVIDNNEFVRDYLQTPFLRERSWFNWHSV